MNRVFPEKVTLVEVGPRDGLQNIVQHLSAATRVDFINLLSAAGLRYIEVGSFVSPKKVPQMQNSGQVLNQIHRTKNCAYLALTPNMQGLDAAIAAGADHIAVFGSASNTFTQKNIGCNVQESLSRFQNIIQKAKQHNIQIRGYLSCVLGCPYEGDVPYEKTAQLAKQLIDMGCYEVSMGDTIGIGTPDQVVRLLDSIRHFTPLSKVAVHFHDTYGQALANIYAALQQGVSIIDSAVAGLGGCPYAPGASGNVATEDVLYMLNGLNIKTNVNLNLLLKASDFICQALACHNHSKVALAMHRTP